MEIIEAVWEKRNLGVDVIELTCSADDDPEGLKKTLCGVTAPYSVLKLPPQCPRLMAAAQECGYSVVEMGITVVCDSKKFRVPEIYKRFFEHIDMRPADDRTLDHVMDEIKNGNLFETDRIALDPFFSREIAGRRYYNWCADELERGGRMGIVCYKDRPSAFILYRETEGVYNGLLAGVMPEAAKKGLGFLIPFGLYEVCRLNNGRYCIGRISSNNLPILRLDMMFGFEIKSTCYVLVRHL